MTGIGSDRARGRISPRQLKATSCRTFIRNYKGFEIFSDISRRVYIRDILRNQSLALGQIPQAAL